MCKDILIYYGLIFLDEGNKYIKNYLGINENNCLPGGMKDSINILLQDLYYRKFKYEWLNYLRINDYNIMIFYNSS